MGGDATVKAIDLAMTWVITFLRRKDVQKYLRMHKVDNVFSWLAKEIRSIRAKVNAAALLNAFDRGIGALEKMVSKVKYLPFVSGKAIDCLKYVKDIRLLANSHLNKVVAPVQEILEAAARRLDRSALDQLPGIVNVNNIHFRGTLPEASAVTLMRDALPPPSWLSNGAPTRFPPLVYKTWKKIVDAKVLDGWPALKPHNVESFAKMTDDIITGPARLYRILAPNSRAMSDCWVTEAVFKRLQNSADPRSAWRKHLAVWPNWNVNGQFVTYDIRAGESLKVWRGPASGQVLKDLPDRHLEGGWEQIVFNIEETDIRNDAVRQYVLNGGKHGKSIRLQKPISYDEYRKLDPAEKSRYTSMRAKINHPSISGPFDTGWGYLDFDGAGLGNRIGIPALPAQATTLSMGNKP